MEDLTAIGTMIGADIKELRDAAVVNDAAVALNTAKAANVTTDLTVSTDATEVTVESSDGTNAVLAAATTDNAGIMSASLYDAVTANSLKVTNVDHPLVETAVPVGALFTDIDDSKLPLSGGTLTGPVVLDTASPTKELPLVITGGDTWAGITARNAGSTNDEFKIQFDNTTTDVGSIVLETRDSLNLLTGNYEFKDGNVFIQGYNSAPTQPTALTRKDYVDGKVVTVINDLTSDSTTSALSAAQGKALEDVKVGSIQEESVGILIDNMIQLTQAEYDALALKVTNTFYIIVG